MSDYPLSLVEFKSWLESKDESEIVGETGITDCCPIANALKESKIKAEYVKVKADTTIADDYFTLSNPDWVERFVRKVDNEEKSITAKKVLEVLEEVEK